jgi:hypothetical protein
MLVIGQVTTEEEICELKFVAQVIAVGNRFRYLARQNNEKNK